MEKLKVIDEVYNSTYSFPQSSSICTSDSLVTPSLINYVPSIIGCGFQSRFEDSNTTDLTNSRSSLGFITEDATVGYCSERCDELWRAFRDEAGPWMTYRFTLNEWKLDRKLPETGAPYDGNTDFDGVLTKEIIASGLSNLDRCPVFYHYSYTACVLKKIRLINIEALANYHYLQYVDVSGNQLTTLKPLGNLPFLKYLDASRNLLTEVLDFRAPHFLTMVNLSYNKFKTIRDLSEFWSITDLNLSRNGIRMIKGLQKLRYLTTLNLSYNRLETIDNLMDLRIQFLYLQNNQIQCFSDDESAMLDTLKNIRIINLGYNQVYSLKIFEKVENVEVLDISYNHISQLLDIYYLRNLKYLNKLNLVGNTVVNLRRYVEVCITNIRNLTYLDGEHINFEFWMQKLSNKATDVNQIASHQRLKLLILEQLNKPQMWDWILPYTTSPLTIIVLVGLHASRRAYIVEKFCNENQNVVLGIPHTTRPKHPDEVEGHLSYFVDDTKFRTMLKEGQFATYQEHLGYYYGFAHSEFKKSQNGILLFYTDLNMAISLKSRFFNTKLVLALPSTRKVHLKDLMKNYAIRLVDSSTLKIIDSPAAVKYCELEFQKHKKRIIQSQVKVIVDEIISHVSKYSDLDPTNASYDSGFLQIWTASRGNPEGRQSRRIPPIIYTQKRPNILPDSCGSFQKTQEASKLVSFTGYLDDDEKDYSNDNQCDANDNTLPKSISEAIYGTDKQQSGAPIVGESSSQATLEFDSVDDITAERATVPEETLTFTLEAADGNAAPISWYEEMKKQDQSRLRLAPSKPTDVFVDHASYSDILTDNERVRSFFTEELNERDELLELHWSMPGLFRELVFIDHEQETIEKLNQLVKDIQNSNAIRHKSWFNYNDDEQAKALINGKLKNCFKHLGNEMSMSDQQANEFFVDLEVRICGSSVCKNPACPPF